MVLEAFAAIRLASSIVQFVEFSCKLFDIARQVSSSASGLLVESQDLKKLSEDFQRLCIGLASSGQDTHNCYQQKQIGPTKALIKLANDCEAAAKDLSCSLNSLATDRPNSKWTSFKVALATIWNQPRIDAMERRLDSYRLQLMGHLQALIR